MDPVLPCQRFDLFLPACVDELDGKPCRVSKFILNFTGTLQLVIRQDHQFHPRARFCDGRNRLPHSPHPH